MELLLVEDDMTTSHALAALLRRLGFKVHHARELIGALEELVGLPGVVVLDLPLADGTGLELLKMISDTGLACKVAVLVPEKYDSTLVANVKSFEPAAIFFKPLNFEDFGKWLCDVFP